MTPNLRDLLLGATVAVAGALACRGPASSNDAAIPAPATRPASVPDDTADRALVVVGDSLDAAAQRRIRDYLRYVDATYRVDYRVAVEPMPPGDAEELAQLTATRFAATGVGDAHDGRGLLLWIDPAARRTRVEVGYALEPFLTDLDASAMIDDYLAPWFASGRVGAGIEASIEALVDAVVPQLAAVDEAALAVEGSGGAGAARTLEAAPPSAPASDEELVAALVPQPDPRAARELELELLRRGLYRPDAALYDAAWRRQAPRGRWPASRLRAIAALWDDYDVHVEGARAVAYCPREPRAGPTLLRLEAEGWVIDASAGARLVIYDYDNDGWYALDGDPDYLPLLQAVLPLERVRLRSGRTAFRLVPG